MCSSDLIGLAIVLIALYEQPSNIFRIFRNNYNILSHDGLIIRSIYHIIENINPVSAQWIINNMATISINESETVDTRGIPLSQEFSRDSQTDIYKYVKQLRTA